MKQAIEAMGVDEIVDVPVSPLVRVKQESRFGRIEGLDDDELADPAELERQAMQMEWMPILALPVRQRGRWIQPTVDESGGVDWGAFGTVDFERNKQEFDQTRYKAEKIREQLKDLMILIGIVKERLPGRAKYLVLKYVRMGVIELDEIVSDDMLALAKLYLRARRLQKEIAELGEASFKRRERRVEALERQLV